MSLSTAFVILILCVTEISTATIIPPITLSLRRFHHLSRNLNTFSVPTSNTNFQTHLAYTRVNIAAVSEPLDVCVKASITFPGKLGDCPFTQRVLLTLEEKHLPYDMKLVDLRNKPEWFLKINPEGKVPVVKFNETWVADSDVITQTLEDKYPEPSLVSPPEKASIGSKIFPTFVGFLKSKDPKDGTEMALLYELTSLNDYLKENGGPFINGEKISAPDLSLAPKLYHMEIALGYFKKWSVPDTLPTVKSYMETVFARESFVNTKPFNEDVIAGWRPKVEG
ncbi:putative glutathione S-transferase dhar2 [Ranunculus cassubicifolius]